uniref:Uncharacterized protein n=1 Tax=Knipowitschia caucasica TaxID=637954 RepID=A0AAV2L5X2_KNICA
MYHCLGVSYEIRIQHHSSWTLGPLTPGLPVSEPDPMTGKDMKALVRHSRHTRHCDTHGITYTDELSGHSSDTDRALTDTTDTHVTDRHWQTLTDMIGTPLTLTDTH